MPNKLFIREALCVLVFALSSGLIGGSATAVLAEEKPEVVSVGKPPPLFELADENGKIHRLADLLGRPIVIYFTHNMCHYCTQVIGFLKRAHAAHSGDGLTIITINVWADSGELIRRYKETFGLPFRMLAGKKRSLLRHYEVNYVPIIVFVGRDGVVREIYHHYILPEDFDRSVDAIVAKG